MTEHSLQELIDLCLVNGLSALQVGEVRIENAYGKPIQPDYPAPPKLTPAEEEAEADELLFYSSSPGGSR